MADETRGRPVARRIVLGQVKNIRHNGLVSPSPVLVPVTATVGANHPTSSNQKHIFNFFFSLDDPLVSHLWFCLHLFGFRNPSRQRREPIKRVEVFTPVVLVSLSSTAFRLPPLPPSHLSIFSSSPEFPPAVKGSSLFLPIYPLLYSASCRMQKRRRPAPPKETSPKKSRPLGGLDQSRRRKKSHLVCIYSVYSEPALITLFPADANVDMARVKFEPPMRLTCNEIDLFVFRRSSSRLKTFTTRKRLTWKPS